MPWHGGTHSDCKVKVLAPHLEHKIAKPSSSISRYTGRLLEEIIEGKIPTQQIGSKPGSTVVVGTRRGERLSCQNWAPGFCQINRDVWVWLWHNNREVRDAYLLSSSNTGWLKRMSSSPERIQQKWKFTISMHCSESPNFFSSATFKVSENTANYIYILHKHFLAVQSGCNI